MSTKEHGPACMCGVGSIEQDLIRKIQADFDENYLRNVELFLPAIIEQTPERELPNIIMSTLLGMMAAVFCEMNHMLRELGLHHPQAQAYIGQHVAELLRNLPEIPDEHLERTRTDQAACH